MAAKLLQSLAIGCGLAVGAAAPAFALDLGMKSTVPTNRKPVIGSVADLSLATPDLQSRLEIGVEAGRVSDGAVDPWGEPLSSEHARWDSGRVALHQVWTPFENARFELDANGAGRRDTDLSSRLDGGSARRTGEAGASVSAAFSPVRMVNLKVSAGSSLRAEESFSLAAGGTARDETNRHSRQASAVLALTPRPWLKLEGTSRIQAVDLDWSRGASPVHGAYAFAEPQLTATLSLWSGAAWRIGATQAAVVPASDQFIHYADSFGAEAVAAYRPDREWRYETGVEQRLGGAVSLKTSFSLARRDGLDGLPGALASLSDQGSVERSQFETSLAAPLTLPLLNSLTVSARAAWRRSAIDLPAAVPARLTPQSGYEAELSLGQTRDALAWRMQARTTSRSQTYQMGEVLTQSGGAGLSGQIAYQPGPLRLQVSVESRFDGGRGRQELGLADSAYRLEKPRTMEQTLRIQLIRPL